MHRPTATICLILFVSAFASTTFGDGPETKEVRSLSDRLSQLGRTDIFNALRGKQDTKEQPNARVASLPQPEPMKQRPSRQRAGSAFAPRVNGNDIGLALSRPSKEAAEARTATVPSRRRTTGDLALDLIGSSASSQDTSGVAGPATEVAALPKVVAERSVQNTVDTSAIEVAPLSEADGGFASAEEAATLVPNPLEETSREVSPSEELSGTEELATTPVEKVASRPSTSESPSTEVAAKSYSEIDIDSFDSQRALSQWGNPPSAMQVAPMSTPNDLVNTNPATSSAEAQQAFSQSPSGNQPSYDWNQQTPGFGSSTTGSLRENVLVTENWPHIVSQVTGPKTILIGREATYRVKLENRGTAAADQLSTEIVAPAWADVINSTVSAGAVSREVAQDGSTVLRWNLATMAARGSQTMDVVLVPKTSQPLSLGVNWRHAPVVATTTVEVQEPKLSMSLAGPAEVFFGRPQSYRMTVSNPGTGPAENIVIQLTPPGGGQPTSSHRVERLEAGESKSLDIEITARDPGQLEVRAMALADGDLRSEAAHSIFCRHAELKVDWRGPERKYAGTEAVYYFRVSNPGTAAADQTKFDVTLPAGFKFISASEGHQMDMNNQRVIWNIGSLRPEEERYLELRGIVNQAGSNALRLAAVNGTGDVRDSQTASTEVVALADLKLDVSDPKGPVPVGDEVEYEITITNRGRSTAEQVKVVGLFSSGIEPIQAEGAEAMIADGRVGFRTIATLPVGQKVNLKIRARANSPGTHLFRAEVLCQDLEIKLAAEETTRFFQDDSRAAPGSSLESASRAARFQ